VNKVNKLVISTSISIMINDGMMMKNDGAWK